MDNTNQLPPNGMTEIIEHAAALAAYQVKAMTFRKEDVGPMLLMHSVVGMAEEAGELLGLYKKARFLGHTLDRTKLVGELGDLMWYAASLSDVVQVPLGDLVSSEFGRGTVTDLAASYVPYCGEIMAKIADPERQLVELMRAPAAMAFGEAAACLQKAPAMIDAYERGDLGDAEALIPVFWTAVVLTLGAVSAIARDGLGLSIVEIGEANLAKLSARYGDKFSEAASQARDESAETAALSKAA